jgi:hypothetical protein
MQGPLLRETKFKQWVCYFNYHIQGKTRRDIFKSEILREEIEFKIC